jgi:hypothetical protein
MHEGCRFSVFMLLCCSSTAILADQPSICADRPGKATATCTVPAGHLQVEIGVADWSLQNVGAERDTELVIAETSAKYGLSDRSDIEIDLVPWERTRSKVRGSYADASGIGDLTVMFKQKLTDGALEASIKPFVKLPTAKHPIGNGKAEGGVLVPIGFSLGNSGLAIALTPEIDLVPNAERRSRRGYHAQMAQVASLSWAASERLSLSAELWGAWDWDPAGTIDQYSADGAIAYLVNPKLQLDGGANFGLNRSTPDVELYSGVSVLF